MNKTLKTIPSHEIVMRSFAHANAYDRLFEWRGEFYRGIRGSRADMFRELCRKGVLQRLTHEYGLIDTEETDFWTEEFPLVLKHRRLPVISYCFEWPGAMLKEAALCTLRLESALRAQGMTLQDAHPWNVVFDGTHPVFVDLGSVKPFQTRWHNYFLNEFKVMQYYPLTLMARGMNHAARCLMRGREGVSRQEFLRLSRKRTILPYRLQCLWRRIFVRPETTSELDAARNVRQLIRNVERLRFRPSSSIWAQYAETTYPSLDEQERWSQKQRTVHDTLKRLRPASVIDLGANRGWYSLLAARLGARVIAVDSDDTCVNDLYSKAQANGACIHPVLMNVINPTPAEGIGGDAYPAAVDRFQSEMVMANALVHHLVFTNRFDFRQVITLLSQFTRRWLLVEFMDRDYKFVAQWLHPHHDWYTRDGFEVALRQEFHTLTVLPSNAPDRVFYLCEK